MALWNWLKSLSVAKLLVELAACLGLLVLGWFVVIIGGDQMRHWTNPDYATEQRIKRDFLCFQQRGQAPIEPDELLQLQFEVETLMDSARQQLAPTDFVGKLQKLGLCAEFTTINAGGVLFSDPAKSLQDRQRLGAFALGSENPIQRRLADVETLARVVTDFPADIHDSVIQKLNAMLDQFELTVAAGSVEPSVIETTNGDPGPTIDVPVDPSAWLLVTGAEQSDAAALRLVDVTDTVVAEAGLVWDIAPAELFLIRSWRRSAVPFATREQAMNALNALKDRLPYGAYVRATASWCPDLEDAPDLGTVAVTRCEF